MIHVVCDPGSRYTKFAAARPGQSRPVLSIFPSHEAEDLTGLAQNAAKALKPSLFEPVRLRVVGDGWVPKRSKFQPVLLGAALAGTAGNLAETVLVADCGGLRAHVFEVVGGKLKRTLENERCTSGGGRFVETMAGALNVGLDEIDSVIATSSSPVHVSSPCMVFAESEMISQVNAGVRREDILAGVVAHAVEKVATLIQQGDVSNRPVVVIGGLARLAAFTDGLKGAMPGVRLIRPDGDPMFSACLTGLFSVSGGEAMTWRDA